MAYPRQPNFFIVGVQKAGTTFLAKALSEHPDVFFTRPKEPFFFNAPKLTKRQFRSYVDQYFATAGPQRWRGEGSTNYFHHAHAIDFIHKFVGSEARIMVCLRHPLERALSHYLHDFKRGRVSGSEQLTDSDFSRYSSRSFYADRLIAWRERFPHLLPLFFDDLLTSASAFYQRAADFMDLQAQPIADAPVNEGLRLVWDGDDLTVRDASAAKASPRFPRETVYALAQGYESDIRRTMDLTGRDLSAWLELPDFESVGRKFASLSARPG